MSITTYYLAYLAKSKYNSPCKILQNIADEEAEENEWLTDEGLPN